MVNKIAIYDEKTVGLAPISFLKQTQDHVSMCDMDSYELKKQLAMSMIATSEQMRITNEITNIDKKEIQELLLTKYKRLSINEVYYAFKLERFGEYGDVLPNYNKFDVIYVGQIMERYREWKRKTKLEHNISNNVPKLEMTDKQKIFWVNKGVSDCLAYFEEHRRLEDGKAYVYEILMDDGWLPNDVEYKKRVYKDAIESLEFEYKQKKAKDLGEKKKFKEILQNLHEKTNGLVKLRCKEIVLAEFFRKITLEETKLNDFKEKYKNPQNKHS